MIFVKKRWILALLLCLLLTGCGQKQQEETPEEPPAQEEVQTPEQKPETTPEIPETPEMPEEPVQEGEPEDDAYQELLDSTPVAQVEGDPKSPDGRFEVRAVGASDLLVSGVRPPEFLRIVDTATGETLWEDGGYVRQEARWSPDGNYLLLAYAGRTWNQIRVFETTDWTDWDLELPNGEGIPEYVFLPEDWYEWVDDNRLTLTVGRGGDGEEQHTYRCSLFTRSGVVEGVVLEETTELLESDYDFNRDGVAETLELTTIWSPEIQDQAEWYELRVRQGEVVLWIEEAAEAHVGWNSLFALRMDGEDFLLRYNPYMNQGVAAYQFELFSLEDGGETVVHKERVEFDVNFASPVHHYFDAEEIADFLWAARTLIQDSRLLLSTQGGDFVSDVPASEFEHPMFGEELAAAEYPHKLAEALREYEEEVTAERTGATAREELADDYDFNHNGIPEKVELVTVVQDGGSGSSYWRLEITERNKAIWADTAYAAHAGWNTIFAVELDGEDYLLQYHPTMYHGSCTYSYQVFSLDAARERLPLREASVEFDINWQSPLHEFDAEAVLAFVEQLNGELAEGGALLLNTDDAVSDMDPEAPQETLPWLQEDGLCPNFRYSEKRSLAENLRLLEECMTAAGAKGWTYERG